MSQPLASRVCPLATMVVAIALASYCWINEGDGATLAFAIAATTLVATCFLVLTRRALFSAVATATFVGVVLVLSNLGIARDDMSLHAWDVVVFLRFPMAALSRLRTDGSLLIMIAAAVFWTAALTTVFMVDTTRVGRRWSAAALMLCAFGVAAAGDAKPAQGHTQFFWTNLHLTSFYASIGEAAEALWRGGLLAAAPATSSPALAANAKCARSGAPPHILLIHEESIVEPDLFPGLDFDRGVMPFFSSDDGQMHKLRVETYGGASWLTEFSVFAGVSSHAYGSMRNFVQTFTAGKMPEALPRVLADCGYHNMMFTPWDKAFMAVSRFFESIGFDEIIDHKAQGNTRDNERDRFFFANALNRIGSRVATSRQPLFLFIETMSAHWPYNEVYMPEVHVAGGGPGTPPQMSEYLRRLAMVKMDDDWLRAELARRFPAERFLIVRYGDHHPTATLPLLGLPSDTNAEDTNFKPESVAFLTFYAVNGVRYAPPRPPRFDVVDVGYLGAILLDAAGLPAPPSWRERSRLMNACEGRFWTCPDHNAILTFHRQLIDGGLMGAF